MTDVDAWQRFAIGLARSSRVRRVLQPVIGRTRLARQFIIQGSAEQAVAVAQTLYRTEGITATLSSLGEYVADPAATEATVRATCDAAVLLGAADFDVHVSIDPTAIGYLTSAALCRANAERIATTVAAHARGRACVMLDMEDLSLVEPTLHVFRSLAAQQLPMGITLQTRLRRTSEDVRSVVEAGAAVRLVKGAFPLGAEHDHQGRAAITASYLAVAGQVLSQEAREAGVYPSFATHDDVIVRELVGIARDNGWRADQYEVECLYGVRPSWQHELRSNDVAVRNYLPFGTDWWPYAMRRVGEQPRNLLLVTRSLISR